jgi:hypothetical protein
MWVSILATIFLILALAVVVWGFVANERRSEVRHDLSRLSGRRRIKCNICAQVFEGVPMDGLVQCPVCGSFQDAGENVQEELPPPSKKPKLSPHAFLDSGDEKRA